MTSTKPLRRFSLKMLRIELRKDPYFTQPYCWFHILTTSNGLVRKPAQPHPTPPAKHFFRVAVSRSIKIDSFIFFVVIVHRPLLQAIKELFSKYQNRVQSCKHYVLGKIFFLLELKNEKRAPMITHLIQVYILLALLACCEVNGCLTVRV